MKFPLDRLSPDRLPVIAFGAACVIGLIGAFVGLGVSSFWNDELYTAWVLGADGGFRDVAGRALTDLHPPLYYFATFLYSKIAGTSDEALRFFSAFWAVAAILLFVLATGSAFSLAGRLFAAAMATGSHFWFYQAQNARFYALGFFLATAILALSFTLSRTDRHDARSDTGPLAGMFGLMLLGTFSHFYMLYLSLAVLAILFLLVPRLRVVTAAFALVLLVLAAVYLKFVIGTHAQFVSAHNWMGRDAQWYINHLSSARLLIANKWGVLAVLICFAAWFVRILFRQGTRAPSRADHSRPIMFGPWRLEVDAVTAFAIGVPAIVFAGGVVSSILLSPNFQDRNLLICSPFIWAAVAKLYDVGVERLDLRLRALANVALAALVVYMSTIVVGRALPRNTQVREASHRIAAFESCRGQLIPVVDATSTMWTRSGYMERLAPVLFGHYLEGFARPMHVFREHLAQLTLPPDLRAELQRRVDGQGCPIILWYAHRGPMSNVGIATRELLSAIDRENAASRVRSDFFRAHNYGIDRSLSEFGIFILYVERP